MPTSQTIHQNIPIFAASKNPSSAPDIKTGSNTFNQVLKNEVTNKAKKNTIEQPKNMVAQNNKPSATSNKTAKSTQNDEASEVKDANNDDKADQDPQTGINLNDPGSLLNFVNTLSTLTQTEQSSTLINDIDTDAAVSTIHITAALSDTSSDIQSAELNQAGTSSILSNVHVPINSQEAVAPPMTPPSNQVAQTIAISGDPIELSKAVELTNTKVRTNISPIENTQVQNNDGANIPTDIKDFSTNMKVLTESAIKNASTSPAPLTSQDLQHSALNVPSNPTPLSPEAMTLEGIDSRLSNEQTELIQIPAKTNSKIESSLDLTPDSKKIINNNSDLSNSDDAQIDSTTKLSENTKSNDLLDNLTETEKFSREFNTKLTQERQNDIQTLKSGSMNETLVTADKPNMIAAAPAIIKPQDVINTASISDHIAPRVGSKAWDQAIGQKIVWMVAGGEQSAQLTLNPPDLGPVQVVLSISDNFVDASFVSSHLDVREAIEAAAPKLREMMDSAGISLSGFSVSADSTQSGNAFSEAKSQQSTGHHGREVRATSDTGIDSTTLPTSAKSRGQELGMIDTFA